jgi:hypothetical protein
MKDLELNDILVRPNRLLFGVTMYINGVWVFSFPTNLVRSDYQSNYYLVDYKFGLVRSGETNPRNIAVMGAPGDYVSYDTRTGALSHIPAKLFTTLFPPPNINPPKRTRNSEDIRNPKFLTKIQQETDGPPSDKVAQAIRVTPTKTTY